MDNRSSSGWRAIRGERQFGQRRLGSPRSLAGMSAPQSRQNPPVSLCETRISVDSARFGPFILVNSAFEKQEIIHYHGLYFVRQHKNVEMCCDQRRIRIWKGPAGRFHEEAGDSVRGWRAL